MISIFVRFSLGILGQQHEVQDSINAVSGSGPSGERRSQLRTELDEIRQNQSQSKNSREKIKEQLKSMNENVTKKVCIATVLLRKLFHANEISSARSRTCKRPRPRFNSSQLAKWMLVSSNYLCSLVVFFPDQKIFFPLYSLVNWRNKSNRAA